MMYRKRHNEIDFEPRDGQRLPEVKKSRSSLFVWVMIGVIFVIIAVIGGIMIYKSCTEKSSTGGPGSQPVANRPAGPRKIRRKKSQQSQQDSKPDCTNTCSKAVTWAKGSAAVIGTMILCCLLHESANQVRQ